MKTNAAAIFEKQKYYFQPYLQRAITTSHQQMENFANYLHSTGEQANTQTTQMEGSYSSNLKLYRFYQKMSSLVSHKTSFPYITFANFNIVITLKQN